MMLPKKKNQKKKNTGCCEAWEVSAFADLEHSLKELSTPPPRYLKTTVNCFLSTE